MKSLIEKKYWLLSANTPGLGVKKILRLIKQFRSLESAWRSIEVWKKAKISPKDIQAARQTKKSLDIETATAQLDRLGIRYVFYTENSYPALLKEIFNPPAVLYFKGHLPGPKKVPISVVGARKTSPYGRQITSKIISQLKGFNIIIVSGLAIGIDTLAHQSALDNSLQTIAVMGCGLDKIYPVNNYKLAEKIISQAGCLISEYPPGTPPHKEHFPARNRIISGLSKATLVIEGLENSGSLITAKFALEQNREVMAIPGNINNPNSAAPNKLIKMGAQLIRRAGDISELLSLNLGKNDTPITHYQPQNQIEKSIINILSQGPASPDEIILKCKLGASTVNPALTFLEMKGIVRHIDSNKYSL